MIRSRFKQLTRIIRISLNKKYYGFTIGHLHIKKIQLNRIKSYIKNPSTEIVKEFESKFAKIIGNGDCVSYASARMGFYDLMVYKKLSHNDEVIVLGFTCSVMINAILRIGAKPVYADIDKNSLGSQVDSIKKVFTKNTKMVVAQHSFGIPCNIESIAEFTKKNNVFLLEDCALSLGSKINNTIVGNFGDASLFSTDHTKPINTVTGGLVYSNDKKIISSLKNQNSFHGNLTKRRQYSLWRRFNLERKYCNSHGSGKIKLINLILVLAKRIFNLEDDFLNDDSGLILNSSYPYPAKMPSFIAAIGLIELKRWKEYTINRKKLLEDLIAIAKSNPSVIIPDAYFDNNREIIPLRFAFILNNKERVIRNFEHYLDIDQIWFKEPIISTVENLDDLGYINGSCPISEDIGKNIINIPCNINKTEADNLIKLFRKTLLPLSRIR